MWSDTRPSGHVLRDNVPFILALTTVPPHMEHGTIAVFGDIDVVLRAVVVAVCVHVVLGRGAVCQRCWH